MFSTPSGRAEKHKMGKLGRSRGFRHWKQKTRGGQVARGRNSRGAVFGRVRTNSQLCHEAPSTSRAVQGPPFFSAAHGQPEAFLSVPPSVCPSPPSSAEEAGRSWGSALPARRLPRSPTTRLRDTTYLPGYITILWLLGTARQSAPSRAQPVFRFQGNGSGPQPAVVRPACKVKAASAALSLTSAVGDRKSKHRLYPEGHDAAPIISFGTLNLYQELTRAQLELVHMGGFPSQASPMPL